VERFSDELVREKQAKSAGEIEMLLVQVRSEMTPDFLEVVRSGEVSLRKQATRSVPLLVLETKRSQDRCLYK
jgi:hypothetical protein